MAENTQPLNALKEANRVRSVRSDAKADLKRGQVKLAMLLEKADMQGQNLYDLLTYLPMQGPSKAAQPKGLAKKTATRLIKKIDASSYTTVGELGERRKVLLLAEIERLFNGRL